MSLPRNKSKYHRNKTNYVTKVFLFLISLEKNKSKTSKVLEQLLKALLQPISAESDLMPGRPKSSYYRVPELLPSSHASITQRDLMFYIEVHREVDQLLVLRYSDSLSGFLVSLLSCQRVYKAFTSSSGR